MTIDQIECFVTVASAGSISQAAARLFRSQPNLSYTLKQLETELGYSLMVRTNQGVKLTVAGLAFLEEAQKTLMQFNQLRNFSTAPVSDGGLAFRLASMPFCMAEEAMNALYAGMSHPPAQLVLAQCMRDELISGLSNRLYDLGVAYAYPATRQTFLSQLELSGLEGEVLARCCVVAKVGRGCPYFELEGDELTVEQLKGLHRVYYARHGARSLISTQFRELSGCAGDVLVNDLTAMRGVLAALPAFSLVPRSEALLASSPRAGEMRYFRVCGIEAVGDYFRVTRKGAALSPLCQRFLEHLQHAFRGEPLSKN